MIGLFGKNGIAPIANSRSPFSLFYFSSSDFTLKCAAIVGLVAAMLAFFGIIPFASFLIAFGLYMSFYQSGYPFLSFQWDALLVETGFIAIFYSMMTPPPILLHITLWMLLFRLMLSSGIVKWRSGCPSWRSFCAMDYHFETQPLPNIGGFFAHHLAKFLSKSVSYIVFCFEILVPLLFFGTPMMRLIGAGLTIFFQMTIMATGNYAFFNLLTITLCIPLIDDIYLHWIPITIQPDSSILSIPLNLIGAVFLLYNSVMLVKQFLVPGFNFFGINHFRSFGILNTYGLFAVMTTKRDEIVIEGSLDGIEWKEYVFKYKPGISNEGVKQIAPFQPRLDWQMWFAALSDYRSNFWFQNFISKLLLNSSEVLGLLKENPFSETPPIYIRADRYRFTFCSIKEWRKTGRFWDKKYLGPYLPVVKL